MTSLILDNSKIGEEAFELIWENTNDAIFLIGQDGAILHANPTFTDILMKKLLDSFRISGGVKYI
ncbi:PAS domain S-box protein [Neobacillus niacini]|uniref:PAS domain S-box protein n=1 Tax=Neobacillus niacini TaxID=86668 RepID=UPI002FFFB5A5